MTNRTWRMVMAAAIIATATAGCAAGWDKSFFSLKDVLTMPDLTTISNEEDVTKSMCEGVDGCIEAWTSDQADFLRFDSNQHAADFVTELGIDGYHSNRVVIDFTHTEADAETRELMAELIDGTHSWE